MNLYELPSEMHPEIFQWLNPYQLNQVSRTCKKFHLKALINELWDKHHKSEFPYSLEKTGTSFQKYTICKRRSLKFTGDFKYRKLVLLIEAKQYEEIPAHILEFLPERPSKIFIQNFISARVNEQKDERLSNLFFNLVKNEGLGPDGMFPWCIIFERLEHLRYYSFTEKDANLSITHGALRSLNYLYKNEGVNCKAGYALMRAIELGRIDMWQWALDHQPLANLLDFSERNFLLCQAASEGQKEILLYLLKNNVYKPEHLKPALKTAVRMGRPSNLEVLLQFLPQTTLSMDDLLEPLNFRQSPNETAACLKILLDKGADISQYPHLLHTACAHHGNEEAILMMLEHGADPNYPLNTSYLKNKNVVEMALKKGALLT